MNILHISRTMGQGGAEKVVYQICKESNATYNMCVASTGGMHVETLKKSMVEHFVIPDIDLKNPFLILKTFFLLNRIIKKNQIDIIHSHHRMAAFYSRILCLFHRKIKRIYTAHNVFFNQVLFTNFSLKGSKIVAVGNGVKDNLINTFHINPKDVLIIYNSVSKPETIKCPEDDFIKNKKNHILIGTIGRLSEQKGMDVFISSIAQVINENDNVYGIIIGDGELKESLIQQVEELKIQDHVLFLGYRSDVLELITAMDFIVLSSRWEGFPLTPIETFMMGKTIIASNISGSNEIVQDEINGLLFQKDNVGDLVKKMLKLIYDQDFKKQLEKNALKSYHDFYSYDVCIKKYMNLYKNGK